MTSVRNTKKILDASDKRALWFIFGAVTGALIYLSSY